MQAQTFRISIVSIAAVAAISRFASATDFIYDGGGSGAWTDAQAWHLNSGYPDGAEDCAIIGNYVVELCDGSITLGSLVLSHSNSELDICGGARLIIDGAGTSSDQRGQVSMVAGALLDVQTNGMLQFDSTEIDQAIAGEIRLSSATSVLAITRDAVFGPHYVLLVPTYGTITGTDPDALIQIASGRRLTNKITVNGTLTVAADVAGDATFENSRISLLAPSGIVDANADGDLEFSESVILDDSAILSLPEWKATSHPNANLVLNREADGNPDPILIGDFEVDDCASFTVRADVVTTGSLTFTQGFIDIDGAGPPCFYYGYGSQFPSFVCSDWSAGNCGN